MRFVLIPQEIIHLSPMSIELAFTPTLFTVRCTDTATLITIYICAVIVISLIRYEIFSKPYTKKATMMNNL